MASEEELAVCVHNYEVLYDKSHKDFHRKDIKRYIKLSKKLGDDEMELLEHEITSIFVKRFANAKNPNVTPTQQSWPNYHFSNFNQSVSTPYEYAGQKTNVSPFG